jgi:hypothetical protein
LAEAKPAPCQVRDKTGNPCPRRAEVKILGVAFCGPCAREQEAYFAIGELTEEGAWDHRGEALAEALEKMPRRRMGSTGEIESERSFRRLESSGARGGRRAGSQGAGSAPQ